MHNSASLCVPLLPQMHALKKSSHYLPEAHSFYNHSTQSAGIVQGTEPVIIGFTICFYLRLWGVQIGKYCFYTPLAESNKQ